MKIPRSLEPLLHDGLIDEVLVQLMSGKEAEVYVVRSGGEIRCAKAYKEVKHRSFHKQSQYMEGRKVRNSRRSRAMDKHSSFGRQEQESAWQNAEVDALYRLAAAGVRVPQPHAFASGVLLMELVIDDDGAAAPRLNDLDLTAEQARAYHRQLIAEVVRMLCAGLVHGDLSEFNVLVAADGPVIIDLPQAIDAAGNNNAGRLFARDVDNLAAYFGQFAPELLATAYAEEIWSLYESGILHPESPLTGRFVRPEVAADVGIVLREIDDSRREAMARELGRTRAA
ncbi:MAG: kinase [Desulfuromonadales bacterium GWD2_61_12]|nr:MAG: kinase [Desulfuromonadales bacterium GWC2_61_20]OGR35855.1 MAG: kinase [Desulfuromonadales bacterium GWD2_61_12]HBT82575.1 serine protein kinase RIO [Desulfuromonas sp.]